MAQQPKVIDVSQTFFPTDPNAFPENLLATQGEDSPFQGAPVVAYEGVNFLPTTYGYKSFFGMNGSINIDALTSRCDHVLLYQKQTFENFLIALCEDGIWTKDGASAGAWTQAITLAVPPTGEHREWTWCLIEDELFMYRQGELKYYRISTHAQFLLPLVTVDGVTVVIDAIVGGTIPAGQYAYAVACKIGTDWSTPSVFIGVDLVNSTSIVKVDWTDEATATDYRIYRKDLSSGDTVYWDVADPIVTYTDDGAPLGTVVELPDPGSVLSAAYEVYGQEPIGLNMVGQIGLFKAGIRLGFWDSEDSVSYSGPDDYTDFVTSLSTLANSGQKFNDVIGRIVVIRQFGTGFVIYATKSIVRIIRNAEGVFLWQSQSITNSVGIAYMQESCLGSEDTTHFAWTSKGLVRVTEEGMEVVAVGATDFLKENRDPIYLKMLQNRHLFLQMLSADYINGIVGFQTSIVVPITLDFRNAYAAMQPDEMEEESCSSYVQIGALPAVWVYSVHQATWDGLTKAAGGAGFGYPIDVDVPVFTGKFSTRFGTDDAAYRAQGLELIPDISIAANTTNTTLNIFGGVLNNTKPVSNIIRGAGLPSSDFVAGTAILSTNPTYGYPALNTFAEALKSWNAELRMIKAYIDGYIKDYFHEETKVISGTYFSAGVTPAAALEFANNNLNTVWRPQVVELVDNVDDVNDVNSTDDVFIGMWPVEYYEPIITIDANYNKAVMMMHIKKLAVCYTRMETCELAAVFGTPVLNGGFYDVPFTYTFTSKQVFKTVYIDVPMCHTADLVSSDPFVQSYLDQYPNANTVPKRMYHAAAIYISSYIRYNLDGSSYASGTVPPAAVSFTSGAGLVEFCPVTEEEATINGFLLPGRDPVLGTICSVPPSNSGPIFTQLAGITLPASSFLLQSGSPAPVYPTFEGSFVYDTQLKKWGKQKGQYKQLFDFAPINHSGANIIPYDVFGVDAGCLDPSGLIFIFDKNPSESFMTYGKIGYSRQGFTDAESVIARFRSPFTGEIALAGSVDGRSIETTFQTAGAFTDVIVAELPSSLSARWYNVKISGIFDLNYLEFRGTKSGRR